MFGLLLFPLTEDSVVGDREGVGCGQEVLRPQAFCRSPLFLVEVSTLKSDGVGDERLALVFYGVLPDGGNEYCASSGR